MKNIPILIIIILFISCNNIKPEEIIVIENIRLGDDFNSYKKQLDSLGIKSTRYYNVIAPRYENNSIGEENYFPAWYTNLFDFSDYRNTKSRINHPSIIVPLTYTGTDKVWGTIVLLGHTDKPWMIFVPDYLRDIYERDSYFRQDINDHALNKILESYKEKYGVPTKIDTTKYKELYMIQGNGVQSEYDDTYEGILYTWETKFITINFFTGIDLNAIYYKNTMTYSESTNRIRSNLGGSIVDYLKNEEKCKSYAYIKYQLNDKALEKMKIKIKKI